MDPITLADGQEHQSTRAFLRRRSVAALGYKANVN